MEVEGRWYESFFGDDWLAMATEQDAKAPGEVDFLVGALGLEPGARVLDCPVGHGRHAVELAARGFRATGVDLNEAPLAAARARGADVELLQGDMRELPVDGPFDAVLCLWSSLGYFEDDLDNDRTLAEFARVAAPGGAVVVETINPFALHADFRPRGWTELADGAILLDERELDLVSGRTTARATLVRADGSRGGGVNQIRLFAAAELATMCRRAGLEVESLYAGLADVPFDGTSFRYAVVARKPR